MCVLLFILTIALGSDPVAALRTWLVAPLAERPGLDEQAWATEPLTESQSTEARELLWQDQLDCIRQDRAAEWEAKAITIDGRTMRFDYRVFGEKPETGRALYLSLHGGGGAPTEVNDQQWRNQITLYEPAEGVYLAPRAPTDTWNLWHEAHIDGMFDRLIEDAVAFGDVNPDRVYLMGYSAGGDGVYQLAPRMADRFAAAAMMAGHPNEASPLNLRNLPFAIHVGADDGAYNRNGVAREWGAQLGALQQVDATGYEHVLSLHEGRGHWMNREDAVAVPWMAVHTRDTAPKRVVWRQDDVTHSRFYWLAVGGTADTPALEPGAIVVASIEDQTVTIERAERIERLTILLDDRLVDLDKPVLVVYGGRTLYSGSVPRTIRSLMESFSERCDRSLAFAAQVSVELATRDGGPPRP